MDWVWRHAPVGGSELIALLALADWADDTGHNIYPRLQQLARKLRRSPRAARYMVAHLERVGALVREQRGGGRGRAAQWRLVMDVSVWQLPEKVQPIAGFS